MPTTSLPVKFAPELLMIAAGFPPQSWLRALRVARLLKLARYIPAFVVVANALRLCVQELLAALLIAILLWYVSSVALYLAENTAQPEAFGSITRTMWWSVVTLTTVGYGDTFPVTAPGKIVASIVAVVGIGAVALPSGIIAGAFLDAFRNRNQDT